MRQPIVTQPHDFVCSCHPIQLHQNNTSGTVIGIFDHDAICGVLETVLQTKTTPIFRYDRINYEGVAAAFKSQNFFEPDPIGPRCCASVPSPAAAPDVGG